jgi:hypothetical protein
MEIIHNMYNEILKLADVILNSYCFRTVYEGLILCVCVMLCRKKTNW